MPSAATASRSAAPAEAAGDGVAGVGIGEPVFGPTPFAGPTVGASEQALLDLWFPRPPGLDPVEAAALPMAVETAYRGVDALGVRVGTTVGYAAVQIAVQRGARAIATAGETYAKALRAAGAEVTGYGDGMAERVEALAGGPVDLALDAAPVSDALPALVRTVEAPEHLLTVSDFAAAVELGVRFSGPGGAGTVRNDVLGAYAQLASAGRFSVPVARVFPLADWRTGDWRTAAELSRSGQARGELVLQIGWPRAQGPVGPAARPIAGPGGGAECSPPGALRRVPATNARSRRRIAMMSVMTQPITADQLSIVPANEASSDDLRTIFGTDHPGTCQCQRFKIRDNQWAAVSVEERARRLREQTGCGDSGAPTTSGLVAHLGDEPVGWCAVEPRTSYPRLLRARVPWAGRDEDKADGGVWVVSCFVTRKAFRRRGITYALARATVGFARERGARALEAYPMITQPGVEITWGELHVGSRDVFADAGFTQVSKPTLRRVVMRIDF